MMVMIIIMLQVEVKGLNLERIKKSCCLLSH